MKTTKITLFLALGAMVALYSCKGGSDTNKLFSKKWQLDDFKSKAFDDQVAMLQKTADTAKDSMTKASVKQQQDMMNNMVQAMKQSTLTCNMDGTCEMSSSMMGQTKTDKGKWMLIDDGKKVVLTSDQVPPGSKGPKSDTLNVVELTAEKMTVSGPDGRGGTVSMTYKAIQ